jgi:hypothetical protein
MEHAHLFHVSSAEGKPPAARLRDATMARGDSHREDFVIAQGKGTYGGRSPVRMAKFSR